MEEREIFGSGHAVKVNETTGSFQVAQNDVQFSRPTGESPAPAPTLAPATAPTQVPAPARVAAATATPGSTKGKKKRGDPGNAYSARSKFQTHELTVYPGEDVAMKIVSLSQQGSHAICIVSANGTISNVTLRLSTCGGTSTYEGIFEIRSLTGSLVPMEKGSAKSRCGQLSVSFSCLDGRVIGGGLAGSMVAAGPVKVEVWSFVPGHRREQKAKKQKKVEKGEHMSTTIPTTHLSSQ